MPAFPQLSTEQMEQLVDVIRGFQIEGLRDQYERKMLDAEMPQDDDDSNKDKTSEAKKWVKQRSTPGESIEIPEWDDLQSDTARGKAAFDRVGCRQCHDVSKEGSNESLKFFDTWGRPVAIRNLDSDRFRAGNSRSEIYKRIVLGVPGTPHPALVGVSEQQIVDIVQYVHERSKETHRDNEVWTPTSTNFQRHLRSGL